MTVWCVFVGAVAAQTDDVTAIQHAFWDYRAAIAARDGARAQRAVTGATLEQYDRLRDLALHANEVESRALPLFEKLMVLGFRVRLSASELQSMSGAMLFKRGVEDGWLGDSVAVSSDVASIRVDGSGAAGVLVSGGRPTTIEINFQREQGDWRFDLPALGPVVSATLERSLEQAGIGEDDYVLEALTAQNGEPPPPSVWAALVQ